VTGRLVLVGTPIGNLGDLSPRAIETLAAADEICCEDTRRTRQLLTHSGITGAKLSALHAHNEDERIPGLIEKLQSGILVALVTDAGMPGISDPGSRLVAAAASAGVDIGVVPGPSAATSALVISAMNTDRFVFEGFLPRKGTARRIRLAEISTDRRTSVIYEAPARLAATLADLADVCGAERKVAVARELTKLHEEVWRGALGEAASKYSSEPVRGEVVVVLEGAAAPTEPDDSAVQEALELELASDKSVRDAADAVSAALGVPKRRAYKIALELKTCSKK
jgi:16S rRNA (cytidine1402-2'-O)-methyltransferase